MKFEKPWRDATIGVLTMVAALAVGAGLAYAKLPQPPLDDAAKAKAEEGKAKAAEAAKKAREAEERAMDRAVERYNKEKGIKTATTAAPPKKK